MKKILFAIFIVSLLFVSTFSVVLMYRNNDSDTIQMNPEDVQIIRDMNDVCSVEKGTVTDCLTVTATVAPTDERSLTVFHIVGEKSSIVLFATVGDKLESGTQLALQDGQSIICSGKMLCVDIQWVEDGCNIVCLDFSKTYLTAMIPVEYLQYELFKLQFSFIQENGIAFSARLTSLDYLNQNGYVAVKFQPEEAMQDLLPGTTVQCDTVVYEKKDVLSLPLLFVMERNGRYYVELVDNGTTRNQEIKIGVIGINSVEILSGVSEGDQVLCPDEAFSLAYSKQTQSAKKTERQ